jgi:hypothetical protein
MDYHRFDTDSRSPTLLVATAFEGDDSEVQTAIAKHSRRTVGDQEGLA